MTQNDIDILIITFGFITLLAVAGILGEVAVWIAKLLGFEEPDQTDFMARLEAGEILDKNNIFE